MRTIFGALLLSSLIFGQDTRTGTLANGLKVIVQEDHAIPNVAMYFFYRIGSRNERPGTTGLSRFFEHMMFNGARKYGPKQFDKQMDNIGGNNNRSFFFGAAHPYGRVPDEASIDRIRREDIVDYHKRTYVGRNLIVIVAGDFDPATAKARVSEIFGAAPAGSAYQWAEDRPPARNSAPKVLLIDKPDATQTYFLIAQPGARKSTSDRVALSLVNTLFGGRFTSMVNEELRVNSGLTYGAGSRVEMARLTGGLSISSYTKTETTAKAIDVALDVLKRLHDTGITAEQLASAKAYMKGTYPPSHLQTSDQIAGALGEIELFGLGPDEVNQFFARVDGVTLEQANAVARKYYRTDNLTFVLLGNAAQIRQAAAKYGAVVERSVRQPGWAAM